MFDLLGVALAAYTIYAAISGEVFAKSGVWGKTIQRDQTPGYFWTIIVIYAGLSVALIAYF